MPSHGATVLDASALLAYLQLEPGADTVERALSEGARMSAVNLAEALSKLAEGGLPPDHVMERLRLQGFLYQTLEIVPFTADDALVIAGLYAPTRSLGLSLGDRACLGLAERLQLPALTTDRSWSKLKSAIRVELAR